MNIDCQTVSSSCATSPYLPLGREGHTSIVFKSYTSMDSNRMCKPKQCGPYCKNRSDTCFVNAFTADDIPEVDTNADTESVPEGLLTSNDTNCPPTCCSTMNEVCLRTYDISGRKVHIDEELLLVFGGMLQLDIVDNYQSIIADCTAYSRLNKDELEPKEKLNSLFLINNCGVQVLNDIWFYQVQNDVWYYVKPHVDAVGKAKSQQIPQARVYHSAVYLERPDFNLEVNKRIIRKYMYVYGGYSVYCQNACDDFWYFEIAYGPQRYYPTKSENEDWNRGNRWTQIYSTSTLTPGKRLKHSMVIDNTSASNSIIYLFGGIFISTDSKTLIYDLRNDLWTYDMSSNKWSNKVSLAITQITRSVSSYSLMKIYQDYILGWYGIQPSC